MSSPAEGWTTTTPTESRVLRKLGPGWESTKSSFWLLPALGIVCGLILAEIAHRLDRRSQQTWTEIPIIFSGSASDAHYVLSAITGSLITVIAMSFSLTVVILQLASSQYSPRVLRSFEVDRGLQVALGIYIATFVFSLMTQEEMYTPTGEDTTIFIPVVSISITVFLALVCVAVLAYLIQHVSKLIQSSTIVRMAERDTLKAIARLEDLKATSPEPRLPGEDATSDPRTGETLWIRSKKSGYLKSFSVETVVRAVTVGKEPVVVEIPHAPGHFVSAGQPLAKIRTERAVKPDAEARRRALGSFSLGQERSFRQDFAFGLRQLSDVALRALSPGVNDPTTAMQALDRLETLFIVLGTKEMPSRAREYRFRGARVMVKIGYPDFDDNVGLAFDQIRRAALASGDVAVLDRFLEVIERAVQANTLPERQKALWSRAYAVARQAPRQIPDPHDAANLVRRAVRVGEALTEEGRRTAAPELQELTSLPEEITHDKEVDIA